MRLILITLLPIFLASCSAKVQTIEKPVYLKCKTPEVPKSELENFDLNDSYPIKLQKILNNYLKLKRENELLREAIKVCQ